MTMTIAIAILVKGTEPRLRRGKHRTLKGEGLVMPTADKLTENRLFDRE